MKNRHLEKLVTFINWVFAVAIGLLILGIVVYTGMLGLWIADRDSSPLSDYPLYSFGLPISAIAAFGIVGVFRVLYPPSESADSAVALKVFGLEFTGPSGPITLWVICYLAFILSIKIIASIPDTASVAPAPAAPTAGEENVGIPGPQSADLKTPPAN